MRLTSKNTWERVLYLMGPKSFEHAKQPISKDDVLPLILAFVLIILIIVIGVILFSKIIPW